MAYTPIQLAIFNAALEGFLGGSIANALSAISTPPAAADYATIANEGLAFAQQFDTTYAQGASDPNSLLLITQAVSGFVNGRRTPVSSPLPLALDYAGTVNQIIAAVNEVNALETPFLGGGFASQTTTFRARNVVQTNTVLATYTVAAATTNDNVNNVQGDIVILAAQTTVAQNGPWQVGLVTAGVAPLTRPSWWQSAAVLKSGLQIKVGGEGTVFKNTTWQAMTANDTFTVDTNDPQMFPLLVTVQRSMGGGAPTGQVTVVTVPIRSANAGIAISRTTATTPSLTVMYAPTIAGVSGIVPGAIGTASLTVQATVAAGTINAADGSVVNITIDNQL